jgi:DNA-binding SARP family transcriptional activator
MEFRILGPVQVVEDGSLSSLGGNRERDVLALLLLSPNQVVSSDRLIDELWDGRPPEAATDALRVYVSRLRKALRQSARDGVLRTSPPGYLLRVDLGQLDADRFERLVARAREEAAGGDHNGAASTLRKALAVWRGPALADVVDSPSIRTEASRLEEARLAALEERIEADLACGHHTEVIPELDAMTRAHRVRERLWAQRMTALYRAGRQAEALRAYQELRGILGDDLGIEPSSALVRLETAILRQDPALDWFPPPRRVPVEPPGSPRSAATIEERLRQMPFTGRDTELGRLKTHMHEAGAGRGGLVMVMGEPGIGKTRLAEELSVEARHQGWSVLWGRCYEGSWTPPYNPFVEAIDSLVARANPEELRADMAQGGPALARLVATVRAHFPDLPDPLAVEPDEERFRLLDAATQLLLASSARTPVLVCIDDLHWSDGGSIAMLTHLARFVARHRLLVVGTYRDTEVGMNHPLTEAIPALARGAEFDRIHLQGLPAEAVDALLRNLAAQDVRKTVTAAFAAETDGNPFFLREVLRHLVDEGAVYQDPDGRWTSDLPIGKLGIPDSVREVVNLRLNRLSESARRLLSAACAFDGPFPFDVVAPVSGLTEREALDALDEALAAQLLDEGPIGGTCVFSHALIRHTIYAQASSPRRLRLHRQVAEVLEAEFGDDPTPAAAGEIAHHYQRSAELPGAERGASFALLAATHAESRGAHEEAARFLRAALALLPHRDPQRPRILGRLSTALVWALAFDEAATAAVEAAAALATSEGAESAAGFLSETAYACTMAGSSPHAWAIAGEGLSYTGDRRDVVWARLVSFDYERRAAENPDHPGLGIDSPERRESARILRAAHLDPFAPAPMEAVFSSSEEAEESTNVVVRANWLGELGEALPAVQADIEAALAQNRFARALRGLNRVGMAYAVLGRLPDAQQSLEQSRSLSARLGRPVFFPEALEALCGALGEGWEEARDVFWPLAESPPPAAMWALGYIRAGSVRIAAHLGDRAAALRFLDQLVPWLERAPMWTMYMQAVTGYPAEALWLLKCLDHVESIEAAVREKVVAPNFRGPSADGRLSLARLCALTGRYDEAVSWFAEARSVLAGMGARPLLAVAHLDEALMYARRGCRGDTELARPLLDGARDQFAAIGMTGWLRRADELAARLEG